MTIDIDLERRQQLIRPYYHHAGIALYHGRCLDVLRSLPDDLVDAVVTDPPYSSGGLHAGARMAPPSIKYRVTGTQLMHPEFDGDNRDQRSYLRWSELWLSEAFRVARPGAPVLVFSDWRQLPTLTDAVQMAGWTWRGLVVWDKTEAARPDRGRFRHQCEFVVWGSKGPFTPDPNVGCLPGMYRFVVKQSDKFHITGKPTELMVQLLAICPAGGLIFDGFAGSGTTLIASALTGRRALGVEQSAAYCQITVERLQSLAKPRKLTR